MKGNPEVIAALNEALKEELGAIHQYFVHAEMCEDWQYEALAKFNKKTSIDEMKHAEKLIERIIFLEGAPTMEVPRLNIGKNVQQQLTNDLAGEHTAVTLYNRIIKLAREKNDANTADLLQSILDQEEDHTDYLEAQLHLITEVGYERYLSQRMEKEK